MRSLSSWSDNHGRSGDAATAAAAIGRYAGDERLAAIFKQMRDIVGVSQSEMARRLGTDVSTLLDFEAGAVTALPPWPETVRIVDRYAELSQIDPSPILSRLLQLQPAPAASNGPRPIVPTRPQRQPVVRALPADAYGRTSALPQAAAGAPRWSPERSVGASTTTAPGAGLPADEQPVGFDGRSRTRETTVRTARQTSPSPAAQVDLEASAARRRRRRRRTVLVAAPLMTIVLTFASMVLTPRPFYKVARALPSAIAMPLLAMLDTAVTQTAAVRDGLRWIELDDPRLRKGDRLSR